MNREIIIIGGPTATGKTKIAIEMAQKQNGEIVSADSMQIYKLMNIGSAKPTAQELSQVPHHLVDEIDPRQPFSVAIYQKRAKEAIFDIFSRERTPIVCGGTGLYLNSLMYDMDFSAPPLIEDYRKKLESVVQEEGEHALWRLLLEKAPKAAERIHPNNVKKIIRALEVYESCGQSIRGFEESFVKTKDYKWVLICLNRDRHVLYERINKRVESLIEIGLVDEVKSLLELGLSASNISMKGIGYKEIIGYLDGEYDISQAISLIQKNTRHYAKRQLTWLRRFPQAKWFHVQEGQSDEDVVQEILTWLHKRK